MMRFLLLFISLFITFNFFAQERISPPEFDDSYRLKTAYQVNQFKFENSRISLSMESGQAAEVYLGNTKVGLFLLGNGDYTYVSQDPYEHAVLHNNLKKTTSLEGKRNKDQYKISDTFKSAFILYQGKTFPEIMGSPLDSSLHQPFTEHLAYFSRARVTPRKMLFIKQAMDYPDEPVVQVELQGSKESILYQYDSIVNKNEVFSPIVKGRYQTTGEQKKYLWPITISDQPVSRDRKAFLPPQYLLTDLTYNLQANQDDSATLYITETIVPMGSAQRIFMFDFYNKKWDDNGNERVFKINSITNEAGIDLPFIHENDSLLVMLPEAIKPNQAFKLNFDIEGNFLIRPGGNNFWQLGVEPWFPQPGLSGQYYTVHSTIRVQDPFVPIAPGKTVSRKKKDGYTILKTEINHPIQFAVINAGKYFSEEDVQDGLTIRVASYGTAKKDSIAQLQRLARKIIKYYEPWLGPFPFSEFNIIEVASYGFGQAPPGTMYITKEAFNPLEDRMSQAYSGGVNHRYAHEIAHQYWGHVVKMGSGEEQWITESFSEYTSSMFIKQLKGDGGYKKMVSGWKYKAKTASKSSSIPMANRLSGSNAGRNRTYLVYDKGAYLLYKLHQELGDDLFFSFLRSYQGIFAWKYGTTNDCVNLLKALTKKDYSDFFEKYFWGTDMPK